MNWPVLFISIFATLFIVAFCFRNVWVSAPDAKPQFGISMEPWFGVFIVTLLLSTTITGAFYFTIMWILR